MEKINEIKHTKQSYEFKIIILFYYLNKDLFKTNEIMFYL